MQCVIWEYWTRFGISLAYLGLSPQDIYYVTLLNIWISNKDHLHFDN